MNKSHKILILTFSFISIVLAGMVFFQFKDRPIPVFLPPAQTYDPDFNVSIEPSDLQTPDQPLPEEVNLKIPFTSQAPHQNWNHPYKEFCEEASILMTASYIKNQSIESPDDADQKMLAIKKFEEKRFGFYEDTGAGDTAIILREYYELDKVIIHSNPTAKDIKNALAQGKAVIAPLAGQELGNPYYHQPGPLYHMLVIKGYRKNGDFITNDPGTKRGADFIYSESVIMNALSDWSENDLNRTKKAVLIVG